MRITVSVGQKW